MSSTLSRFLMLVPILALVTTVLTPSAPASGQLACAPGIHPPLALKS